MLRSLSLHDGDALQRCLFSSRLNSLGLSVAVGLPRPDGELPGRWDLRALLAAVSQVPGLTPDTRGHVPVCSITRVSVEELEAFGGTGGHSAQGPSAPGGSGGWPCCLAGAWGDWGARASGRCPSLCHGPVPSDVDAGPLCVPSWGTCLVSLTHVCLRFGGVLTTLCPPGMAAPSIRLWGLGTECDEEEGAGIRTQTALSLAPRSPPLPAVVPHP